MGSSKAGQKVLVEPHIANFRKFNSNTGKADNAHEIIQALSHFSYHQSGGQMCLCDLQGGQDGHQYVLSDVVLLSITRQFGATDLGQPGIEISPPAGMHSAARAEDYEHHVWPTEHRPDRVRGLT